MATYYFDRIYNLYKPQQINKIARIVVSARLILYIKYV